MAIRVSFVIPHKGRENLLKQTLQSIACQDCDLSELEVVIVTQNSALKQETYPDAPDLKVTTLTRPEQETISRLRNVGVEASGGDYVAFLDADVELSANWVSMMRSELEAESTRVLVSAVQQCEEDAPPLEKIRTAMSNAVTDANVRFLPGRNLFMTREVFDIAGGFPEHLVTCEDYYFTDCVYRQGSLFYSSRASYVHLGEDKEFSEMFKKEIWRGQSNLQSIKGRRIPLSEVPSFLVPVWILLFFLAGLVSAIMCAPAFLLVSLFLMALPIALYSFRLKRLVGATVSSSQIVLFYMLYFPARIIGTYYGLFAIVKV